VSTEVRISKKKLSQLPPVCAITGKLADGRMSATYPERKLGPLVILVLLGPVGVAIIFAFLWLRKTISLELPYTEKAFRRLIEREQLRTKSAVSGTVFFVLGLALFKVSAIAGLVCLGLTVLSYLMFAFAAWSLGTLQPEVRADKTSVKLIGVDPAFVAAVEAKGL
jgi:hypothetical protein